MAPVASPNHTTPREWMLAALIVTAAAGLRFASLGSGVPYAVASDEPFVMERAFAMLTTGDFHPHVWDYPTLYFYLQTALATVRFIVGAARGEWYSLDEVTASDFYLWGRALTATLGTLTVLVTWRAGRRISPTAGLLAAALLALQPQHVRESHFVLTDVPMTFFVSLTLLASVRARERARLQAFALAGAAVGLSAATKYPAGLALVMPLVALACTPRALVNRTAALGAMVAGTGVAFLIAAPYTVLDLPGFLNGFGELARSVTGGRVPETPHWWTLLLHLNINNGTVQLATALAGLVASVVLALRARDGARVVWLASTAFSVVFFAQIAGQTLIWGRYLMPILPMLSILAGAAVATLLDRLAPRLAARKPLQLVTGLGLAVLLAYTPASRTITLLSAMSKTSSNQLAYDWILEHVPPGSYVVVEAEGMKLPRTYRAQNVQMLIEHAPAHYRRDGVDYVVASSLASRGAMLGGTSDDARAYQTLFAGMDRVFDVSPSADHPGSTIHVYRVRRDPAVK